MVKLDQPMVQGSIRHGDRTQLIQVGRIPLLVGANDAARSNVGEVALCEFVVGVVMEDY